MLRFFLIFSHLTSSAHVLLHIFHNLKFFCIFFFWFSDNTYYRKFRNFLILYENGQTTRYDRVIPNENRPGRSRRRAVATDRGNRRSNINNVPVVTTPRRSNIRNSRGVAANRREEATANRREDAAANRRTELPKATVKLQRLTREKIREINKQLKQRAQERNALMCENNIVRVGQTETIPLIPANEG